MKKAILTVKDLRTYYYTEEGVVPAVDGLDFEVFQGETFAIVGESGCGKSVTSMSVLRLIPDPPGKIVSGEIMYMGEDLLKKSERQMRRIRGNDISMIFQEPMTSLNPVFTVGRQIGESLIFHQGMDNKSARQRAVEMLKLVEIPDASSVVDRYPHQLSGGMRQRVMIAMALACDPQILIADEPTTALDVTIQAQILRLLRDLREKTGASIMLITHDLGVVAQISDRVMVMYAGEAVEQCGVREIYKRPLHPYTVGLLKSIPKMNESLRRLPSIPGMVPTCSDMPAGCRFAARCDQAGPRCLAERPAPVDAGDGHMVRCFLYSEGVT